MASTLVFIGALAPQQCCLHLYLQNVQIADSMILDIIRDRLAISGVGESSLWLTARRIAESIVAAHSFYHPDWQALTMIPLNWVEAHDVEAIHRTSGFFDPALAMLDLHPEQSENHADNEPFKKAAELITKNIQPLNLAMRDWYQAMVAYWSRDEQDRLEALFHAYRAIEVLKHRYKDKSTTGPMYKNLGLDERAFKSWEDSYSNKVRHGDWNDQNLKKLTTGDGREDRKKIREVLEDGPRQVLMAFLNKRNLPLPG